MLQSNDSFGYYMYYTPAGSPMSRQCTPQNHPRSTEGVLNACYHHPSEHLSFLPHITRGSQRFPYAFI
jgi:hypothetical protein